MSLKAPFFLFLSIWYFVCFLDLKYKGCFLLWSFQGTGLSHCPWLNSTHLSMPIIQRSNLFILSHRCCIFLSYISKNFYFFFVWSDFSTLFLRTGILSSTWSILFIRISFGFSNWNIEFFNTSLLQHSSFQHFSVLNSAFKSQIVIVMPLNLVFMFSLLSFRLVEMFAHVFFKHLGFF